MLLQNKLLDCFPTASTEKVEIEIGYTLDMRKTIITERLNYELDANEFAALISEKIKEMDSIPTVTVYYPFGNPKIILVEEGPLKYE